MKGAERSAGLTPKSVAACVRVYVSKVGPQGCAKQHGSLFVYGGTAQYNKKLQIRLPNNFFENEE